MLLWSNPAERRATPEARHPYTNHVGNNDNNHNNNDDNQIVNDNKDNTHNSRNDNSIIIIIIIW